MKLNIIPGGSSQAWQNPHVGRFSPRFGNGDYVQVGFKLVQDPDPASQVGSKHYLQPGNPGKLLTLLMFETWCHFIRNTQWQNQLTQYFHPLALLLWHCTV
jgi:hypothetical protein